MSSDPVCVEANIDPHDQSLFGGKGKTEDVVVNKRQKLANVLTFLKGRPLDSCQTAPSVEVKLLAQKDCHFVPHVLGLRTRQTLVLRNQDRTEHQYCVSPAYNSPRCATLRPGEPDAQITLDSAERYMQMSCGRHPWERAYLAAFDHPFFGVSDQDGRYEIKGVPPGEYTVVAWHEQYGERAARVKVGPGQSRTVDFAVDEFVSDEDLAKPLKKSGREMMESAVRRVEPAYPESGSGRQCRTRSS